MVSAKPVLTSLNPGDLESLFSEWGGPQFRARQVLEWVYRKARHPVRGNDQPRTPACGNASPHTSISVPSPSPGNRAPPIPPASSSSAFAMAASSNPWSIPANPALYGDRRGSAGWDNRSARRARSAAPTTANSAPPASPALLATSPPDEIVEQILQAEALDGDRIDNIVFMGMGEPLANLRNLLRRD